MTLSYKGNKIGLLKVLENEVYEDNFQRYDALRGDVEESEIDNLDR